MGTPMAQRGGLEGPETLGPVSQARGWFAPWCCLLSNALGLLVASVVLKGMKVTDAARRTSA